MYNRYNSDGDHFYIVKELGPDPDPFLAVVRLFLRWFFPPNLEAVFHDRYSLAAAVSLSI